jgi:hypothetical protein
MLTLPLDFPPTRDKIASLLKYALMALQVNSVPIKYALQDSRPCPRLMPLCKKQDTLSTVPAPKAGIVKFAVLLPRCLKTVPGMVPRFAAKLAVRDFAARTNFN